MAYQRLLKTFSQIIFAAYFVFALGCNNTKAERESEESGPPGIYGGSTPVPPIYNPTANANCRLNNFSQTLSNPRFGAANNKIELGANLSINALNGVLTSATTASLISGGSIKKEEIRQGLAKLSGSRVASLLQENWGQHYTRLNFPLVKCAIAPATSLTETAQGQMITEVAFQPAIPYFISPADGDQVLMAELAQPITVNGVNATIRQSGDSGLGVGQSIMGSVNIRPESGAKYGASLAIRIVNSFGDKNKTAALGLLPEAVYYISGGRFVAVEIVVNDSKAEIGTVALK